MIDKTDRFLPRVWTENGYYYPIKSELGITYENDKFNGDWNEFKDLSWCFIWIFGDNNSIEFNKKVEACTGMVDKNNNLIYENDILEDNEQKILVTYNETRHCFMFEYQDTRAYKTISDEDVFSSTSFEVIGNINENPNLLGA